MKAEFNKWLKETGKDGYYPVHPARYKEINQFAQEYAEKEAKELREQLKTELLIINHDLVLNIVAQKGYKLAIKDLGILINKKFKDES